MNHNDRNPVGLLTGIEINSLREIRLQIRIFKFQSKSYGAKHALSVICRIYIGEPCSRPPVGDTRVSHRLCDVLMWSNT